MADGSTREAGALEVGDEVMGYEEGFGQPTRITGVEPARKLCIRMTFRDRSIVECSEDHRFPVWNNKLRRIQEKTVLEILHPEKKKSRNKYKFLRPSFTEFYSDSILPVAPYLLGLIVGDGSITGRGVSFTTASQEILIAFKEATAKHGLTVRGRKNISRPADRYQYTATSSDGRNHLVRWLRILGLMGCNSYTKFIPRKYLIASVAERLQLLAGLIDTDGHVYNKGRMIEYCTMSSRLAEDIQFLVRSLGGYCGTRRGHVGQYRLGITLNKEVPCRVPYKKYTGDIKRNKMHIGVVDWQHIGEQDCVHISVENPSELFLLDNFVVTHNTDTGAVETARGIMGSKPKSLSWAIAPTHHNLEEAERALLEILYATPGMVLGRNQNKREYRLAGGRRLQFRSAADPDNLRGPNIDGIAWFDECAFGKAQAHIILRERVMATGAPIIYTTTPHGRNWVWTEVQIAGFPPDQAYGEFFEPTEDGGYFVSHYPTWQFPWSPKSEIDALRSRIPKITFDQELGALFITDSARVFRNVEECFSRELPLKTLPPTILMGLDLARFQDWTALVIMTPGGRVLHVDRWNDTEWSIQRPRIMRIAREWSNALIVVDRANVGSVIEEDLRNAGAEVMAVDLNAPSVKSDLIETLILAFETKAISIPDPKSDWASQEALQLYKELCWYEHSRTPTGRLSYNAPKGLTDDVLMSLGLANWGRVRGGISSVDSEGLAFSPEEFESLLDEDEEEEQNEALDWDGDEEAPPKGKRKKDKEPKLPSIRPAIFKGIFGRQPSALGFHTPRRSIWDGHE